MRSPDKVKKQIKKCLQDGYKVLWVFVTNQALDKTAEEYLKHNPPIQVYEKNRIAAEYIDLAAAEGIKGEFSFKCDQVEPLEFKATNIASAYLNIIKPLSTNP